VPVPEDNVSIARTEDYKALTAVHERLLEEFRTILEEHAVLQREPFDADEHRLHHLRIRRFRERLAGYRTWAASVTAR
jgi:hypothetical protein